MERKKTRIERDLLGELEIPVDALWGIHTKRAMENFPFSGERMHPELIRAMGAVKWACALESIKLGQWSDDRVKRESILKACEEMFMGAFDELMLINPLQGGAGTSLNMCTNEIIANRALQLMGKGFGDGCVSVTDDINLHQSTNDVCPTAIRIALIRLVEKFLVELGKLVESFKTLAEKFKDVSKVGRTQYQDAVVMTLGAEMRAYSRVLERDYDRIKSQILPLSVVNLGGTAIGTSIGAPKAFVSGVVQELSKVTGLSLTQAEDLVDATQNQDELIAFSGSLKTLAFNLIKILSDLRFLSSGPQTGIGEINLPSRQAGSSIMPGKVNPVIPEFVIQVAMLVIGHDTTVSIAGGCGNLELNPFLPLMSHCLLNDLDKLRDALMALRVHCIDGISVNKERCEHNIYSSTALITSLVPIIGYDKASEVLKSAKVNNLSIKDQVLGEHLLSEEEFDELLQ